jgi:L-cysteine S-thiosulfotransferase
METKMSFENWFSKFRPAKLAGFLIAVATVNVAIAQQKSAKDAMDDYRASLQDGNPADLNAARGEALWKTKRGPKNASLEACDLGLGAGKVKGAVGSLPRYFADVNKVMDAESRLVHCMVTLQGFKAEDFNAKNFTSGAGQKATVIEDLVAYIYDESRGVTINVPQNHPMEKAAFARGKDTFYFKGGTHDFSCASCHNQDGKRIRLQELPNLTGPSKASQDAFAQWPAYRVSQGGLRTMQWRMQDCLRGQRMPELNYLSQTSIDLITYLGVNANGGKMAAPALKR